MIEKKSNFTAQRHGFRFRNRFDLLTEVTLPGGITFDPGEMIVGLCGGMCYVALDYYHMGLPVPSMEDVATIPTPLMRALRRRQRESNSLPVLRKILSWVMKPDGEVSRLTAWREFPRLRQKLDAGEPGVLLLVRTRGLQNPTLNHQVTALGYRLDPLTRQTAIRIYDPNVPGHERELTLDLASATGQWDLKMDAEEPLRGFFLQNYRRKPPPQLEQAG